MQDSWKSKYIFTEQDTGFSLKNYSWNYSEQKPRPCFSEVLFPTEDTIYKVICTKVTTKLTQMLSPSYSNLVTHTAKKASTRKHSTADPWTWGMRVWTAWSQKSACNFRLLQDLTTNSLLLTTSFTDNIVSHIIYKLYVLYTVFLQ